MKQPVQLKLNFNKYNEQEAGSALLWYSWLIAKAEALNGNPKAQRSMTVYARQYRTKIEAHEELVDLVVDIHRDAIKTGKLNTPLWNNAMAVRVAVM